jgi:hypothetical protein
MKTFILVIFLLCSMNSLSAKVHTLSRPGFWARTGDSAGKGIAEGMKRAQLQREIQQEYEMQLEMQLALMERNHELEIKRMNYENSLKSSRKPLVIETSSFQESRHASSVGGSNSSFPSMPGVFP